MVWMLIRVSLVLLLVPVGLMGGTEVSFRAGYPFPGSLTRLVTPVVGGAPVLDRTLVGGPVQEGVDVLVILNALRARQVNT